MSPVLQRLRQDVREQVECVDWSLFQPQIEKRIEQEIEEHLCSEEPALDVAFGHLRKSSEEQVESVDWSLFQSKIEERIEQETEEQLCAQELSLDLAFDHLRKSSEARIEDVDWSLFHSKIEERIEQEIHAELEQAFEPDLLAWKQQTLSTREGQWSAFTEQVVDAVYRDQVQNARLPLDEQTLKYMREEIEVSVDAQEARFQRDFSQNFKLRWRITKNLYVKSSPSFWRFLRPVPWAWGSAALALAVAVFLVGVPSSIEKPLPVVSLSIELVEAVQFEGTVTLSQSEDLTVIWLASAS